MKIKVDEIGRRAIIELSPTDFFLVKRGGEDLDIQEFPYGLAYRIDMSYAGKQDQVGSTAIFLDEDQYQKLRGVFNEVI